MGCGGRLPAMQIEETPTFGQARARIPSPDDERIDGMLDRLEHEHDKASLHIRVPVGSSTVWATPPIEGETGRYRITWRYDDPADPRAVETLTIADLER